MVQIIVTNTTIEVSGHSKNLCNIISATIQFYCSLVKVVDYKAEHGFLFCQFEENEILDKLIEFLKSFKTSEIYINDRRVKK